MAPLPYSLPDAGDGDAADALDWGPGVTNVPAALEGLPYGNFSKVNDKIGRIADFSTSSYGNKYQGEFGLRSADAANPAVTGRGATPSNDDGPVDQFLEGGEGGCPLSLARARAPLVGSATPDNVELCASRSPPICSSGGRERRRAS